MRNDEGNKRRIRAVYIKKRIVLLYYGVYGIRPWSLFPVKPAHTVKQISKIVKEVPTYVSDVLYRYRKFGE